MFLFALRAISNFYSNLQGCCKVTKLVIATEVYRWLKLFSMNNKNGKICMNNFISNALALKDFVIWHKSTSINETTVSDDACGRRRQAIERVHLAIMIQSPRFWSISIAVDWLTDYKFPRGHDPDETSYAHARVPFVHAYYAARATNVTCSFAFCGNGRNASEDGRISSSSVRSLLSLVVENLTRLT